MQAPRHVPTGRTHEFASARAAGPPSAWELLGLAPPGGNVCRRRVLASSCSHNSARHYSLLWQQPGVGTLFAYSAARGVYQARPQAAHPPATSSYTHKPPTRAKHRWLLSQSAFSRDHSLDFQLDPGAHVGRQPVVVAECLSQLRCRCGLRLRLRKPKWSIKRQDLLCK